MKWPLLINIILLPYLIKSYHKTLNYNNCKQNKKLNPEILLKYLKNYIILGED